MRPFWQTEGHLLDTSGAILSWAWSWTELQCGQSIVEPGKIPFYARGGSSEFGTPCRLWISRPHDQLENGGGELLSLPLIYVNIWTLLPDSRTTTKIVLTEILLRVERKKKDVYQSDNQTLSHFDMMWYAEISWAEF